jgi:hypothetical protein
MLVMDLIFFPLLELGPFAIHVGLGLWPALFSLGMMLAYSIVWGLVYGMIDAGPDLTSVITKRLKSGAVAKNARASPLRLRDGRGSDSGHQNGASRASASPAR